MTEAGSEMNSSLEESGDMAAEGDGSLWRY